VLLLGVIVWAITTEVLKRYRTKKERMNDAKRSKRFSWTPIVLIMITVTVFTILSVLLGGVEDGNGDTTGMASSNGKAVILFLKILLGH